MDNLFKGIKQVTKEYFDSLSKVEKLGVIWFVRESVFAEGESKNSLGNDKYYIYFGSRPYGYFWEGEHEVLAQSLNAIAKAIGLSDNFAFSWEGSTSVVEAFDVVKEWDKQVRAELSLKANVADLVAYASDVIYKEGTKQIVLLNSKGEEIGNPIDTSSFVRDGMISGVKLDEPMEGETGVKYLVITFNTDAGKEEIRLDVTTLIDVYSAGLGVQLQGREFSAKVSTANGNLLVVDENGLFAAMYYDGDDIEGVDYKDSLENGGTTALDTDLYLADTVQLSNVKSTVKLNGKQVVGGVFSEKDGALIEGATDSYAFWVKEGAELTIEGDGDVMAQEATYSMAVWANGGVVNIYGGKFYNEGNGCDLIYASNGGKVYIYGGEFHPCRKVGSVAGTANEYTALNIKDRDRAISEIKVYGGTFYNFNPANNVSEGANTNFVADGYVAVEVEPNVWVVKPE